MSTSSATRNSAPIVPKLTIHATYRAEHYNLSVDDIAYCLQHASVVHKLGDCFRILRGRDIPQPDQGIDECTRLDGTVLVVAQDGWIKTVYRNSKATRKIRRKPDDGWGFRPDGRKIGSY